MHKTLNLNNFRVETQLTSFKWKASAEVMQAIMQQVGAVWVAMSISDDMPCADAHVFDV